MRKLEVWAFAADAELLSKKLLRLKCVDVDTFPISEDILKLYDASDAKRKAETELERIRSAIRLLTPYGDGKKSRVRADLRAFRESKCDDGARSTVDRVLNADARLSEIAKERMHLSDRLSGLYPWRGLNIPLSPTLGETCALLFGTFPVSVNEATLDKLLSEKSVSFRKVSHSAGAASYCFVVYRADRDAVLRILNSCGFAQIEFREGTRDAATEIADTERRIKLLNDEEVKLRNALKDCGKQLPNLQILSDIAATEKIAAELRERMAETADCVLVQGWVPESKEKSVEALLETMEVAFDISAPQETEIVPVKLKNNAFASCFEWVVAMYSLPAYGSYDPTPVMSFFYVLLFATMMADAGYGLLLILGGFLAPLLLHMEGGTRKALNMFGWCGIGCIFTGVLFGGYFGDLPLQIWKSVSPETVPATLALLADPVGDPVKFLIIGIILGFVHLVAGQFIDFVIALRQNVFDAICDHVFYWVIYAGLILLVLGVTPAAYYVAGVGAILVILTAGRKEKNLFMRIPKGFLGLYGLINFGSDLISYARILAIALSGSVLAQVFNILATMSESPVFRFSFGIIILIVGHVLNCVLSALSGFVHTSRLQYVEFFGKFYKDGGRPYAPMLPSETFSKY